MPEFRLIQFTFIQKEAVFMPILAAKENCTGCTACASVCPKKSITMSPDADGFLLPKVNESTCIGCGLCEKTCPVLNLLNLGTTSPKAYGAFTKDDSLRAQSSSGGLFSELALAVLRDGGTVFAATYDDNFKVIHTEVKTESELKKLRGAKYSQSDLGDTFLNIKASLDSGRPVLFSGTPCQVGGLKAFLGNDKDNENLITVDFVCHSVPSPMAWQEYVKHRADTDNGGILPKDINLRSKHTGWSRYQYSNLYLYQSGNRYESKSGGDLYMKLFVNGYISRESCENCKFKGYSRVSDITLGDFWGIWDISPEIDDDKGISVVLVQSERGAKLLDSIKDRLTIKQVSLEESSRQNPAMVKASPLNPDRRTALDLIREGKISQCEEFFLQKNTQKHNFKSTVKSLLKKLIK